MAFIFLLDPDSYSPPCRDPSKHLINVKHLTGAYWMLKAQQHCHSEFRRLGILSHPEFQEFFLIYFGDIYVLLLLFFFLQWLTDWKQGLSNDICVEVRGRVSSLGSLCPPRGFQGLNSNHQACWWVLHPPSHLTSPKTGHFCHCNTFFLLIIAYFSH